MAIPHVLPYQGSKRLLAPAILAIARERLPQIRRLYEPFGGSAALTLAAVHAHLATQYVLADTYAPLTHLWTEILHNPHNLADLYAQHWQNGDFLATRQAFNAQPSPDRLLYLLTRCVKAAVRFNREGQFNQAADRRRLGTHPQRMQANLLAASVLLRGLTEVRTGDALQTTADAGVGDVAYLDPPWHGTTVGRDTRYVAGYGQRQLFELIQSLHDRGVIVLLSYDGERQAKVSTPRGNFVQKLPKTLQLERLELPPQRSAQATLLGRAEWTTESLYVTRR